MIEAELEGNEATGRRRRPKLTQEEQQAIIDMHGQGSTAAEIAKEIKCGLTSVQHVLRNHRGAAPAQDDPVQEQVPAAAGDPTPVQALMGGTVCAQDIIDLLRSVLDIIDRLIGDSE